MYRYLAVKEAAGAEQKNCEPCGIRVFRGNAQIVYIADVFTDMDSGEHFAALCTREQLDPIHLFEVIEDFLP